jgi:hypothetical protein
VTYGTLPASMAAQVYESSLELAVELATPAPIDPTSPAYPYPPLIPSGATEQRRFKCLCLENDYLVATVVPDLGGRILRVFDKRVRAEVFSAGPLKWHSGGARTAFIPDGISLFLNGRPRLNESGPTDFMILPGDEESDAAIWIAETSQESLSFHLRVELAYDRAELLLEARIFNRRLSASHYNGGLSLGQLSGRRIASGVLAWNEEARAGLLVTSPELAHSRCGETLSIARFARNRSMAPRQLDTWTARLALVSGIETVSGGSSQIAVGFSPTEIEIASSADLEGHKLLLLTKGGETLESPLTLEAANIRRFPLPPEIQPQTLAILSPSREEVLRADVGATLPIVANSPVLSDELLEEFANPGEEVDNFAWKNRALAENLKGLHALAQSDFEEANFRFEQSLLYNAEDHLVWLYKAVAGRLSLSEWSESAELPNAHYLAPLEPALRAEAFLAQPINPDPKPNPLLASFKDSPSHFIEVACLLLEAGLFSDASRWIDESLRHVNLPMLHYLYAYCLTRGARLPAEAATHVAAAEALPLTPPFPSRQVEGDALAFLGDHFPRSPRLREYFELLTKSR